MPVPSSALALADRQKGGAQNIMKFFNVHFSSGRQKNDNNPIIIENLDKKEITEVDKYWGDHTVNSKPFKNAEESLKYLEQLSAWYPLAFELMGIWGNHENQVVLDYGCGPGNNLVGFLVHANALKIVGIDVSEKVLRLARQRLELHHIEPRCVRLIKISDNDTKLPLENDSIDYAYCGGVLHHTSNPGAILKEFKRVLRPGGQACVMVYNYYGIFVHLYIAYEIMINRKAYPGQTLEQVFTHNTDGPDCPISRYYKPEEFISLCNNAGLSAEFLGGYLIQAEEIDLYKRLGAQALADERLPEVHKSFLRNLTFNKNGLPMFQGKYAGNGGVYILKKE
jgi:SAM-dependent methyltransferase